MVRRLFLLLVLLSTCSAMAGDGQKRALSVMTSADAACVLYLSDGSAWEVRVENRPKAGAWPAKTPVGVFKVDDREWPYRIVARPGKANGEVVAARRLVRIR
jgi:hypothetical protein